jgi:hypothetical protein
MYNSPPTLPPPKPPPYLPTSQFHHSVPFIKDPKRAVTPYAFQPAAHFLAPALHEINFQSATWREQALPSPNAYKLGRLRILIRSSHARNLAINKARGIHYRYLRQVFEVWNIDLDRAITPIGGRSAMFEPSNRYATSMTTEFRPSDRYIDLGTT